MINKLLYKRLRSEFGEISIVHEGETADVYYERSAATRKFRLKFVEGGSRGEEFYFRCPLCNDHKPRLYINHRFGVFDKKTQTLNLWLANCFNENCFDGYAKQRELYDELFVGQMGAYSQLDFSDVKTKTKGPVELPGEIWPLKDMLTQQPHAHIIRYLKGRFISPALAAEYEVGHCLKGTSSGVVDRMIIPVIEKGKLVTWQARRETDEGTSPKYLFPKDVGVASYWYNFDVAVRYRTIVVVEGPLDAWGVHPNGLGSFGKKISGNKLERLVNADKEHQRQSVYALMLDPTMNEKDIKNGHRHHMEVALAAFNEKFPGRVFPVWMPRHTDPGSMPRWYCRRLVEQAGKEAGILVSWEQIECAGVYTP